MAWVVIDREPGIEHAGVAIGPFPELIDVEAWACHQLDRLGQPVLVCEIREPVYKSRPRTHRAIERGTGLIPW